MEEVSLVPLVFHQLDTTLDQLFPTTSRIKSTISKLFRETLLRPLDRCLLVATFTDMLIALILEPPELEPAPTPTITKPFTLRHPPPLNHTSTPLANLLLLALRALTQCSVTRAPTHSALRFLQTPTLTTWELETTTPAALTRCSTSHKTPRPAMWVPLTWRRLGFVTSHHQPLWTSAELDHCQDQLSTARMPTHNCSEMLEPMVSTMEMPIPILEPGQ